MAAWLRWRLVGGLVGWMAVVEVGWLDGWLAGCDGGWLVGRLAGGSFFPVCSSSPFSIRKERGTLSTPPSRHGFFKFFWLHMVVGVC